MSLHHASKVEKRSDSVKKETVIMTVDEAEETTWTDLQTEIDKESTERTGKGKKDIVKNAKGTAMIDTGGTIAIDTDVMTGMTNTKVSDHLTDARIEILIHSLRGERCGSTLVWFFVSFLNCTPVEPRR
jgi:hypothetical protein